MVAGRLRRNVYTRVATVQAHVRTGLTRAPTMAAPARPVGRPIILPLLICAHTRGTILAIW